MIDLINDIIYIIIYIRKSDLYETIPWSQLLGEKNAIVSMIETVKTIKHPIKAEITVLINSLIKAKIDIRITNTLQQKLLVVFASNTII